MTLIEKIVASPHDYTLDVETLGECKIDSPIRNREFIDPDERILITENVKLLHDATQHLGITPSFERAGPHQKIFHDPSWSRVGIVTAGGLCPGLNHVIKGLVEILMFDYGIKTIYGIRYGYAGLIPRFGYNPIMLDTDKVDTIHEHGGTMLGSSRGQQDTGEIVDALARMNINILFCIGGDGSLRCAHDISEECRRRKLSISVIGIPKTIDNDLHFVGRSFGFETAVAEATQIIQAAHTEAKGTFNGIGLVRLMGRDSGFIAAYATLANPVVNFCLIPELDFEMEGPHGLLAALSYRFDRYKDHAVIVVAEGAGQRHIAAEPERRDASGNILKKDIGEYLRQRITQHFKTNKREASVKYFDPSYTIRSVPAKGTDAIRCYMLARNAVHAAMAGRTDCVVGNQDDWYTLVPIRLATIERQKVNLNSDLWRAVMDATGQLLYFGGESNGFNRNGETVP
ncbi:MAG: ATP-dependent 6-phosphofructokinase [Kiritimatiellia bacterium]|jgi:6-phosphofructokinase 1|nr:ATP-dependent 6-phosphofructokinase [Kiritimatiellia bacterium]MDD4172701.1 ATP-dependent 6-phosphofructokinase [Kiritimatiellia bacterium]MDD4440491.1 ATP-dependent 6-phosphofructokinase [Kiritimatiellia bacterium]NLC80537.1 ATP-dependent 6-phosphofructokinase [Lentisphaerota bacterium]